MAIDNAADLQPHVYVYQPFTVISSGKIIIYTLLDIHGFVATVAHLVGHVHNGAYCMGRFTVKMCEDHPILGVNGSPL